MITGNQKGFTLIEFIIYFAIIILVMTIILQLTVSMTNVAARERSSTEVNQNLRLVERRFSQVSRAANAADTSLGVGVLKLNSADTSIDPTFIRLDTTPGYGRVQISQTVASPTNSDYKDLTSDKVDVTTLTFEKITNGGSAKSSIKIVITMRYRNADQGTLKYYQASSQTTVGLLQ